MAGTTGKRGIQHRRQPGFSFTPTPELSVSHTVSFEHSSPMTYYRQVKLFIQWKNLCNNCRNIPLSPVLEYCAERSLMMMDVPSVNRREGERMRLFPAGKPGEYAVCRPLTNSPTWSIER